MSKKAAFDEPVLVKVADLKFDGNNPNVLTDTEQKALEWSIKEKGFKGIDRYVDPSFFVRSKQDVYALVTYFRSQSYEERCRINELQHQRLKHWRDVDWQQIFS